MKRRGRTTRADAGRTTRDRATLAVAERIERRIFLVRGERVMLDADLAVLYGVPTRALVQAIKRNPARFPPDFMFQLSAAEMASLRSQIVISNKPAARGGRRYPPYAFAEQGVAMLSSVLRSERAAKVNVEIMRTFVRLRKMLATHAALARKLAELEQKYDGKFCIVFRTLQQLVSPPAVAARPARRIGFRADDDRPCDDGHRPLPGHDPAPPPPRQLARSRLPGPVSMRSGRRHRRR